MLLVMLLKMLTRTRKTVTRIVILPGTLSGGTRKLRKDKGFSTFWVELKNSLHAMPYNRKGTFWQDKSSILFCDDLIHETMTNMPAGK